MNNTEFRKRPANRRNMSPRPAAAPPQPVQPQEPQAPLPSPQHPQEKPVVGVPAIKALLLSRQDAIARILPPGIGLTVEGLIQNALQQILRERRLMLCTPYSVLDSVLAAAAVGLDFVADQAFLVPFSQTDKQGQHVAWHAGFLAGYKGMMTVASRFGWKLDVQDVRANDMIDISKGTENRVTHKVGFGNRGGIVGVYCVVRDAQHRVCFVETMDMADIAAVRTDTPAWKYHENQMARKAVVRRAYKFLPKDSSQMRLLAEVDDRLDDGQAITDLVRLDEEPDGDVDPQ